MDAIGAISNESQTCLNLLAQDGSQDCPLEKSYGHLEMLIDINQQLLNVIGVNHTAIENVCRITAKYGFHSKLTGAGGGGCVLTLLRNDTSATVLANLRADLEHAGYESWETVVGSYGVLYHTKDADTNTESSN
ncbi:uncharacterized protein TRIADDRAFT_59087 [Trichoplax adhaerens]|uniref:GHMP kinase C-terminal domain-containing protein n=1 Tax=Trichoplax adhaerens TaxID=10228 RepID=B3S4H5_TRIAD|nr:hypothetical protein TRIADDRAFT_59087 [Trichoplax adhaerens]EDV22635.1 hypothetical protein TRIADDRAFT_59087 [Trichoplax adhaerens]|eukprot:XP_002115179.1 hypothetical protein TRIADDRAFT_59087 [Trichoplax adhaerens]